MKGDEAIKQYFVNTELSHGVMGQGIVMVGYTCLAIFALYMNNLSYLSFGHVGSLQKQRSDLYEAEDNTTVAAYHKLKQHETVTAAIDDVENAESTGGIELNSIYTSPGVVAGKQ